GGSVTLQAGFRYSPKCEKVAWPSKSKGPQMFQSVDSVVIVGGGSAGWLTALVLDAYCPFLKVRLIRPRANNPIGVGESTQPDLPIRLAAAKVDLGDFCVACDATMKCGIFYRHWNGVGEHYWHPFTVMADSGR